MHYAFAGEKAIQAITQRRSRRALPKTVEGLQIDSELFENSVNQRRADVATAVNRYRRGPAIFVPQPFVTSRLSRSLES